MTAGAGDAPDPTAAAVGEAADALRRRLAGREPSVAVVLGSGLGPVADRLRDAERIPFAEVPHFPPATVGGHAGDLVAGTLAGRTVLAQSGRFHLYEGRPAATAALAVRTFAAIGVRTVVLASAAGGIRRTLGTGAIMLIADHVNLIFRNPLTGPALPGEERFPDMSDPYDRALRELAREVARARRIALEEGVYAGMLGPSYETPAEVRMLERLGADAVGMSAVVETVAARARGVRCLGFAVITNPAAGLSRRPLSHAEVVETAARVQAHLGDLIEGVIARL